MPNVSVPIGRADVSFQNSFRGIGSVRTWPRYSATNTRVPFGESSGPAERAPEAIIPAAAAGDAAFRTPSQTDRSLVHGRRPFARRSLDPETRTRSGSDGQPFPESFTAVNNYAQLQAPKLDREEIVHEIPQIGSSRTV